MTKLTLIDVYHDDYFEQYQDGNLDYSEPHQEIKRWSVKQFELFGKFTEAIVAEAERIIHSDKELLNYLTDDGDWDIYEISIEDEYGFHLALEDARRCSCCPTSTNTTTAMFELIFDEEYRKELFDKRRQKKAEKEEQERIKLELAAEQKRLEDEKKELEEFERLKEKFGA